MRRMSRALRTASRWRTSPVGVLLAFATLVVLAAGGLVLMTVPSPEGWPPWGEREIGERIQIVALIVGVFGLGGVVLTLIAGVFELRHIFPPRALTADIFRVREADGAVAPRQWRVVMENGNSFVSEARVEVRAWAIRGAERRPLRAFGGAGWGIDATNSMMSVRHLGFYPRQRVEGPIFRLDEDDESMIWRVRWWTERSGPERLSTVVRADESYND